MSDTTNSIVTRINPEAGLIFQAGEIVRINTGRLGGAAPDGTCQRAQAPTGIEGTIGVMQSASIAVIGGRARVLLVPGLTPLIGSRVYISTTAGRGTTVPPNVACPIGTIYDNSRYLVDGSVVIGNVTASRPPLLTALHTQFYAETVAQNLNVDGNYIIGGCTYYANNTSAAVMQVIPDEGLRIACNAASTNWGAAVRSGAMIGILLSDLTIPLRYGDFSEIRVWCNFDANRDQDFETTRLGLETKQAVFDASTYWVQMIGMGANTAQPSQRQAITLQGRDSAQVVVNEDDGDVQNHNVMGFRWQNPNVFETFSSPFPDGFPPVLANMKYRGIASMSAQAGGVARSRIRSDTPLGIAVALTTQNTSGTFTGNIAELIVQYVPIW